MDDVISRQAAIDVIDAAFPVDPMKSEYTQGLACGVALAKTYVEQLPSAEPKRKAGKWEVLYSSHKYKYHCSECGANHSAMYDFCPSCGARMEG